MKWFLGRFKYAWLGIRNGLLNDKSILFQFVGGVLAFLAAYLLGCSVWEWLWILLCVTLVIVAETFNSCIERCVDYISLERDPRAGLIKDMAAAAVMIVCVFAVISAIVIMVPKLMN
ncbi:hypothetical protein C815_00975 [Firmicutes bacterium M10-2]|nr:hypothetical protein C815_00975 [Firmicutes bacterium M10-2]